MTDDHGDFQHYLEKWRRIFTKTRTVAWRGNWLENDYCVDCRYCCGPQGSDEPFPMALLPGQIEPDNGKNFYLADASTACIGSLGCKSHTDHGCRLELAKRPLACGLFPLVLANGRLYAYKICPATIFSSLDELESLGTMAATWLKGLGPDNLHKISITLDSETIARRYIDLEITIFDKDSNES